MITGRERERERERREREGEYDIPMNYLFSIPETCRYQKEVESVIVAHNKFVLVNYSLAECYHICNSSTEVTCRSFEFNVENKTCQISEVNKWTESDYFLKDVTGWDYYHRKCYFGNYS